MLDQAFDSLRKATESGLRLQQELFRAWAGQVPGVPVPPGGGEALPKLPKAWAETATGLLRKQKELIDAQFEAGLKNIEEVFRVIDVEDPEEFRKQVIELWRRSFESLRQYQEARLRELQAALGKWTEVMAKAGP
jgi:hypothetical protein